MHLFLKAPWELKGSPHKRPTVKKDGKYLEIFIHCLADFVKEFRRMDFLPQDRQLEK